MPDLVNTDLPTTATSGLRLVPGRARSRKSAPRIVLPTQETNVETVRSFMVDCLVPILAKEFLRRRDASEHAPITVSGKEPTIEPLGKEGGL